MGERTSRNVRRAMEATMVERARALAVEQALAIGMILGVGVMVLPLFGEAGPAQARAEDAELTARKADWSFEDTRDGRHDRYRREEMHTTTQGLRDEVKSNGR